MAKYFDVLVLVYLVKTMFILNACCVIVEVTRSERDTFTCSTDKNICYTYDGKYDICKSWNASAVKSGKQTPNKLRLCTCMCQRQSSTFLESFKKCVLNTQMRNNSTIKSTSNWAYLLSGINYLGAPLVIKPYSMVMVINFKINKNYNNVGNAKNCSIPYKVELAGKRNWIQIDKYILNKTVNKPVQDRAFSVANLTLNWQKGRIPLIHGRVIRIRIKCHFAQNQIVDNFIIFKVNGTFSVNNITEGSITLSSFISPTPSTVIGTTQVFSIVSTVSASYQHYSIRTSWSSPSTLYESTSFSLISPTTMSSSAANSSSPEKQSKDSSAKAILIGAVIGTVLALVIAFLIIFYILRKKKQKQTFSGKHDPGEGGFSNAMTNKNCPSHVLDNPLCQNEAYESLKAVESDKKHSSGVNIDNANYDQCLVVENLSARNTIPSVYDNVPKQKGEDEHAYHPLDPTKREPSSKYQSLIKPENEYSTISDDAGSTSLQEPLYYSTVNDDAPKNLNRTSDNRPKPDPVYNVLEANDSTVQTTSDPVYNVLEQSNEEEGEPVYNVLEQSGEIQGKQEAVYSELESK